MVSPAHRISTIEKELKKYDLKCVYPKSVTSLVTKITERVKFLNTLNKELMEISEELYYYNMTDSLGNLKIESLSESHCVSILKELRDASKKFIKDDDHKYTLKAEKLNKRLTQVALNIFKNSIKNKSVNYDLFHEFIAMIDKQSKDNIKQSYVSSRKKEIQHMVKQCTDNVEKHYQMLLTSEILSYQKTFNESVDIYADTDELEVFKEYILSVFRHIFLKSKKDTIKSICNSFKNNKDMTNVDTIFFWLYRQIFNVEKIKSHEI